MLATFCRLLGLIALLLLGVPGRHCLLLSAAGQPASSPPEDQVYTYAEQMPQLPGGGGLPAIVAAVQQRLAIPAGTPAADHRVFVQFTVGKEGQVLSPAIVQGASPAIDAAVLAAVRRLPTFSPGRQAGRAVRVAFTLAIAPPGVVVRWQPPTDGPHHEIEADEAQTMRRGLAYRRPQEADTTFLRRVLPSSFPRSTDLLAAMWRPSKFGKQLFFSVSSPEENAYGTDLFILDPFEGDTYAVQLLTIPSLGDATGLSSLFFADVNHDGQKELLALSECSLVEIGGRETHYQTQVFQYVGLTSTGRPQYCEDPTPRPYLAELSTAAAVRQALARHQPLPAPPPGKPAKK
jgi:hypothetical protein